MKRYFVETNADNMVVFVDSEGNAFAFDESCFDEPLTLEYAKTADYSNVDGCETADEIRRITGNGDGIVFDFNEGEFESVTEF